MSGSVNKFRRQTLDNVRPSLTPSDQSPPHTIHTHTHTRARHQADGAAALAAGLAQNNKLARLNLSWNGLENGGVCALGAMLGRNDCLSWLDLTNTRMGAEACLMLSEGIKVRLGWG